MKKKVASLAVGITEPDRVIALLVSPWVRLRLEVFADDLLHSDPRRATLALDEICDPRCTVKSP